MIISKKYKIDKLFNFVRITHLVSKNFKVIFIIDRHVVFSLQNLALFNENYPDANTTNNASPIGFCLFQKIITIKMRISTLVAFFVGAFADQDPSRIILALQLVAWKNQRYDCQAGLFCRNYEL